MSNHPGAIKTLELLESLRATVRESVATEEKLNHEARMKTGRERQRLEQAVEEQSAWLTAETARVEAAFQTAKTREESRYTKRKGIISKARSNSKDQMAARIERAGGAQKHRLQLELLEAERLRDAALADATVTEGQFSADLEGENANLASLQKSARAMLRVHPGLLSNAASAEQKSVAGEAESNPHLLLEQLRESLKDAQARLLEIKKVFLLQVFRFLPPVLLLLLCFVPLALWYLKIGGLAKQEAILITVGAAVLVIVLAVIGRMTGGAQAQKLASAIAKSSRRLADCREKSTAYFQSRMDRAQAKFAADTVRIDSELNQVNADALDQRAAIRETIDDKTVRVSSKFEKIHRAKMEKLQDGRALELEKLRQTAEKKKAVALETFNTREREVRGELVDRWQSLVAGWNSRLKSVYDTLGASAENAKTLFPPWTVAYCEKWNPPKEFVQLAKFGGLEVDLRQFCEALPADERLKLPGPDTIEAPLQLAFPDQGSLLFETSTSSDAIIGAFNNTILRLLATAPPGRIGFTIIDPVRLGQNFAGIMHLADYGEHLINGKIWTQTSQIEEKLGELNEHMEKVIQMYLRNEYKDIAQYNEAAGNIAERYHVLVVADFPAGFSETAVRRLQSIASSGARCGVYALIHWDHRHSPPELFVPDQLRKNSLCMTARGPELSFTGRPMAGIKVSLDSPPPADMATEFIHRVGRASRDSSRVEVPFSQVAPPDAEIWTGDTTGELRVPVGRTGATKLQYLAIGKGTRQHALIAGKTGSGKSTLFHVIITNLALWCSPEQVEFYLVDFKKGVEFKCYASSRLPHARVVAIESDREFGLSVLERVDDELKRRGEMFRKLGVQDIPGYKRAGGKEPVPRTLLLIDEFQELFVEDDKVSQGASVLLDRIVRQGRAFGIHVILGSQTLGGAYTVARTTLGQMVIRIALQCNEADSYLIMDEGNPAPRLLTRPGEGIYNDNAGALEGNSPFQTVWLSDEIRDEYLAKVTRRAKDSGRAYPSPLVYEGDAPADIRENELLKALLENPAPITAAPASARVWLGAPNSIKGPTEAAFHRQSGNNLLIVGQRDEAALAMLSLALVSLSAQHPAGGARFYVLDGTAPGLPQREYLERVAGIIPHPVTMVKNSDLAETMSALAEECKKRTEEDHGSGAPAIFLLINSLHKQNKLRFEEDFGFSSGDSAPNPGAQLNAIIAEGASLGVHVIASCDTYNNVNRFLSKKSFGEFEMRVLFQMSANDSANLCDSPKAGSLGLHRALFYNEQEGYLETFRPYALPDNEWLEQAAQNLKRLVSAK